MDENEYRKLLKETKIFLIILAVVLIINTILKIELFLKSPISFLGILFDFLLLIFTYKGLKNVKMYGAICGIILSILLILSMDIISLILGILFIFDCIKMIKYIKQ